jgi:hypothetical protein
MIGISQRPGYLAGALTFSAIEVEAGEGFIAVEGTAPT